MGSRLRNNLFQANDGALARRGCAAIQATFPESSRARVLELLDSYGVESYEQERERVQLAF